MRRARTSQESLKQGAIIMAGLAFAWMTIELAFKPWLHKGRAAIAKTDSDDDDDDDTPTTAASVDDLPR